MLINQQFKSHFTDFKLDSSDCIKFLVDLHGKQGKKEVAGYTFYAYSAAVKISARTLSFFSDSPLRRHTAGGEVWWCDPFLLTDTADEGLFSALAGG